MWTSALMTAAFFALVTGYCHRYEDIYYADLGCKPMMVGDDGCPRSYDCSIIHKRDKTKCYFKGIGVKIGVKVMDLAPCVPLCRCTAMHRGSHVGVFECVRSECPELTHPQYQPGCYYLYEPGKCCSTGRVCSNSTSVSEQILARTVCHFRSQQYQLGDQFYPDEDPCLKCTCMAGFKGTPATYCTKTECNLELYDGYWIAQGCVPKYYGNRSCCPIGWRCPERSDYILAPYKLNSTLRYAGLSYMYRDPYCHFGYVSMKIGDKLSPRKFSGPDTECTCRVPPYPICIQKEHPWNSY